MIDIIIGVIAGTIGIAGFLYQMVRNPFGMTWPMLGFVALSISIWTTYGLSIDNIIIYGTNAILLLLLIVTAIRKIRNV
jgi:hypothetical protein